MRVEYYLVKRLNQNYIIGERKYLVLSNAVEVHIHKLRKCLPEKFIQNVRGVGYIINNKG